MKTTVLSLALLLSSAAMAQDKPVAIPKEELPPSAACAYCVALGTMMTPGKVTQGVRYHGKRYFFHSEDMYKAFMKDPDAYSDPVLPRPMPTLDLSAGGVKFDSEYFKGKTVLVDFWASWCAPCKEMFPILDSIYDANKASGLELLSVGEDLKKPDYDKFLKAKPFGHPVMFDDKKVFSNWHVIVLPALFLVKDGQIISQWVGLTDKKAIEAEVAKALAK